MDIKTKSHKIFNNDSLAILKRKAKLTLNKAAYVGIYILSLSKVLVYKLLYDNIKNRYGNNSRLSFAY